MTWLNLASQRHNNLQMLTNVNVSVYEPITINGKSSIKSHSQVHPKLTSPEIEKTKNRESYASQ